MKSTELHPTTVSLGATRWGSFDLVLEGVNTRGAWTRCTVRIDWALWPLVALAAGIAWVAEKGRRNDEMSNIERTLPASAVSLSDAVAQTEKNRRAA